VKTVSKKNQNQTEKNKEQERRDEKPETC